MGLVGHSSSQSCNNLCTINIHFNVTYVYKTLYLCSIMIVVIYLLLWCRSSS